MDQPYASRITEELNGIKHSLDDIAKLLKLILENQEKDKTEKSKEATPPQAAG
jgi:hypothetical protein